MESLGGQLEDSSEGLNIVGGPMAKKGAVKIQEIPIKKIKLARNSRMTITNEELDGLMSSIKEEGLLQPIGVVKKSGGYEICYGNRRFLACSKLGKAKVLAIVHESKIASDIDIKNLAENVQRRNISLQEIGRYVDILKKDGLTIKEIAVRLGVSTSFIDSCIKAHSRVPKEFRNDLAVKTTTTKLPPGKISMKTAKAILSAAKSYRLPLDGEKKLFKAAKSDDRFSDDNILNYAKAIKMGEKDFVGSVKSTKYMRLNFLVTEEHYDELYEKYVQDGPFKSVNDLAVAILKGEKSVKLNIIGRF